MDCSGGIETAAAAAAAQWLLILDRPRSFQTVPGASAVQPEERVDRTDLRYHHEVRRGGWTRPRHAGDFPTESHACVSSLGKLSAGVGEPISYKGGPARGSCREMPARGPEQPLRAAPAGWDVASQSLRLEFAGLGRRMNSDGGDSTCRAQRRPRPNPGELESPDGRRSAMRESFRVQLECNRVART